jgi:hypothetical protein
VEWWLLGSRTGCRLGGMDTSVDRSSERATKHATHTHRSLRPSPAQSNSALLLLPSHTHTHTHTHNFLLKICTHLWQMESPAVTAAVEKTTPRTKALAPGDLADDAAAAAIPHLAAGLLVAVAVVMSGGGKESRVGDADPSSLPLFFDDGPPLPVCV